MNIFDEVNLLPESQIAQRLALTTAHDGKSFVCPICGNGASGGSGDGIKQSTLKGKLVWHCYRCGGHWSNVDLIAAVEGISDQLELARKLEELFPEKSPTTFLFSRENFYPHFSAAERQASKSASREISESQTVPPLSEPKNYGKTFYLRYKEAARRFLAERGGSYRGLTAATFEKYGVVVHPEFGVDGQEKLPTLIIPYDDYHFVARAIASDRRPTQHGQNAGLYEPMPIEIGDLPTFIVEGELDALSVVQVVGKLGIGCVATGGASKYRKVVPELEKRFGKVERKPSFIVMFDNDAAGKTNGLKLVQELRTAGYPAESFFLEEQMAGEYIRQDSMGNKERVKYPKVDANDLLQKNPEGLVSRLIEGIERTEGKLREQADSLSAFRQTAELAKKAVAENRSGMGIFSLKEYFGGEFFRDIEQTAKYSSRKTGFENIDAAQIFLPGMYLLGALPASGKTTFAWQLLNQLAENGELCIYCSFEMSRAELFTKSMTRELYRQNPTLSERLNLTSANIRRGACRGSKELLNQASAFAKSAMNLRVAELSNTSVTELIEGLKPLVAEVDKSPVVCVDYLQIIPSKSAKGASAKEKIDEVMLRLKDFQRMMNTTLIIISAFNRENYYQNVSFSSFKESGAIEYSADVIWGLENYAVDAEGHLDKTEVIKMSKEKVRKVKFSCLKNRNGGAYECYFRYHAAYDYFEPCEESETAGHRSYEH